MTYTFDENTVSDLHKDAYGFRPSPGFWEQWHSSTGEEKQEIWDALLEELEAEMKAEKAREERAVAKFERRVESTIALGASNRETALTWIMQADDANGNLEYLEYLNGLPYRYLQK